MSVEQKKEIGAEIAKLAENSKVGEFSKKVTEVSSELAENVSEVAERAEKILVVGKMSHWSVLRLIELKLLFLELLLNISYVSFQLY